MAETKKKSTASETFTAEERQAMKDRAKEGRKGNGSKEDGTAEVLDKIAELKGDDHALVKKLHEVITAAGPDLTPRTYYGMPAYAKDGKVLCFVQPASKFKSRYATLGFNDGAALDDGKIWPTSYAVAEVTAAVEKEVTALIKKAVG